MNAEKIISSNCLSLSVNYIFITLIYISLGLPFSPTNVNREDQRNRHHGYADMLRYPQQCGSFGTEVPTACSYRAIRMVQSCEPQTVQLCKPQMVKSCERRFTSRPLPPVTASILASAIHPSNPPLPDKP